MSAPPRALQATGKKGASGGGCCSMGGGGCDKGSCQVGAAGGKTLQEPLQSAVVTGKVPVGVPVAPIAAGGPAAQARR